MFHARISRLASACAILVFLSIYAVFSHSLVPVIYMEELTRSLYNNYSVPQKFAYVGALAFLLALCIGEAFAWRWRRGWLERLVRAAARCISPLHPAWLLLAFGALCIYVHRTVGRDQYLLGIVLGFVGLLFAARYGRSASRPPLAQVVWGLVLAALVAALTVPGFYGLPIVPDISLSFEEHYGSPFSGAMRLAAGLELFSEVTPYYGLFSNLLVVRLVDAFGGFSAGDLVRLIQVSQCLFIAASLLLYPRCGYKSTLLVLLAVTLWAPWISTSGASILAPNSSAYRFLFFPAAIAGLLAARGARPLPAALGLGLLSALALLYNTETGIAISLGLLLFSLLAASGRGAAAALGQALAFAFAFALGAAALLVPVALSHGLNLSDFGASFIQIMMFASGLEGKSLLADPLALLIFGHAMALVYAGGAALFCGREAGEELRFRAAIAMILLIWGMYYINRPHHWNLWSYKYLYTFLMPCWFTARAGRSLAAWVRRPRLNGPVQASVAVVALLLVPAMTDASMNELKIVARSYAERTQADPGGLAVYSGVLVPRACAEDLAAKAEYLRSLTATECAGAFVVARNFFTLANETGAHNREAFIDLFFNSYSEQHLTRNLEDMLSRRHPLLLVDDVEASACAKQHAAYPRFLEWLEQRLSGVYEPAGRVSGWRVFRRVEP